MQSTQTAALALWFFFGTAFAQIQVRPFLELQGETGDPSISPDGRSLAFSWQPSDSAESRSGIYIRPLNGGIPRPLAQNDERFGVVFSPKWSPDGKWIAFLRSAAGVGGYLFVKPQVGGEERLLGIVCNDEPAWTGDGSSVIMPSNGDSDPNGACEMTRFPIRRDEPPRRLGVVGSFPAISPDGKTLAFVRDREIRLLPMTPDGRSAGAERPLVREPFDIIHPSWVRTSNEIVYLRLEDRSVIRRIETRQGATPRDAGSIDGEFNVLALAPAGGPVLGEVYSHDDSYWRIDLHAPTPHFERLRRLPWNVRNLRLAPDGQRLLYTVSSRGSSEVYTSNLDGSAARRLFLISYRSVERPVWSPDGRQIAFTAEPGRSQIEPSHLFVASAISGSPHRLLEQFDEIYGVSWSRDGKALYFAAGTQQEWPIWKLNLADNKLTQITQLSAQEAEEADDRFIYLKRRPFNLLRIPLTGGPEEPLVSSALTFAVGRNELYFVRQDAKPPVRQGLNLYHLDLATRMPQLVANLGFGVQSLQLSSDARFIYAERHDPPRRSIMQVLGLR